MKREQNRGNKRKCFNANHEGFSLFSYWCLIGLLLILLPSARCLGCTSIIDYYSSLRPDRFSSSATDLGVYATGEGSLANYLLPCIRFPLHSELPTLPINRIQHRVSYIV